MFSHALENEDIPKVSKIWEAHYSHEFGLPNLERTVTHAVIRDNEDIVAFGMVKLWPEAIMLLDRDKPKITQAKAMKMLMAQAIAACKHYNFEQLIATTSTNNVADLCRKHYNFKDLPRILLVKEL
jgi:hypothetical protein